MIVKQPFVIFNFEIHFNNLAIPTPRIWRIFSDTEGGWFQSIITSMENSMQRVCKS